jgi:hypothetical protein
MRKGYVCTPPHFLIQIIAIYLNLKTQITIHREMVDSVRLLADRVRLPADCGLGFLVIKKNIISNGRAMF